MTEFTNIMFRFPQTFTVFTTLILANSGRGKIVLAIGCEFVIKLLKMSSLLSVHMYIYTYTVYRSLPIYILTGSVLSRWGWPQLS